VVVLERWGLTFGPLFILAFFISMEASVSSLDLLHSSFGYGLGAVKKFTAPKLNPVRNRKI